MLEFFGKAMAQNVPGLTSVDQNLSFSDFFSRIITWCLYIGGALAVIYLIYGGVLYVTAAGDQEKATAGRTAIVNAIIGIVVIALALVLVSWVSGAVNTTDTSTV